MIALYWNESHLWGLMLAHALDALGAPWRCLGGRDIAAGALAGEPGALLLVPGGFARDKARRLGHDGLRAIRAHVDAGGSYLGFCGGAGLGLTGGGLSLCPRSRAAFGERIQHFASGHIHLVLEDCGEYAPSDLPVEPLAPVWWPGRFGPESPGVPPSRVLARYGAPGHDFMMADLSLKNLPGETLSDWHNLYGIDLSPAFLAGEPCIVSGEYGRGRYVLSYAHLETPRSEAANAWFRHLLTFMSGREPAGKAVPEWDIAKTAIVWDDPLLLRAASLCEEVIALGREHLLLFWRTPWLLGWRRGLPGAMLNGLYAMLRACLALPPGEVALTFWRGAAEQFERTLMLFYKGLRGYVLAERLAMTLAATDPGAVPAKSLKEARLALFGPMPGSGGLCGQLLSDLDELAFLLMGAGRSGRDDPA